MNQKYIWLVTIVLCISLFGLIVVQINYFQSASKIKEEQFRLNVSNALDQVVKKLKNEDINMMYRDGDFSSSSDIKSNGAISKYNSNVFEFTISADLNNQGKDKINFHSQNLKYGEFEGEINYESLSGILGRKNKLTSATINSLQQASLNRMHFYNQIKRAALPLVKRIDVAKLSQKIHESLLDNGIKLDFEYALKSNNVYVKRSAHYADYPSVEKQSKQLFADDLFIKNHNYLYVFFPKKQRFLLKSYSIALPSFILTLVLILSSAFTIFIIFRQKKLSKIKNDFINNMTHEFKTPISTISLASQMLKDNTVTTTASTIDHIAKIINDESRRLSYQVEKVLQMAIFNEGRMKLKLKAINIHKIIQNLLPNFRIRVEDKNGNMYENLDASSDLIMGDEVHISNLISNLLDNAIKYSKDTPEISISTRNKDKGIVISITDNGIGISKEDQKMVFERFFRVHTGNVHDVKGFGLGLSYVKKITDAHGGYVSVDSIPDKGSKFEVYLPLKK